MTTTPDLTSITPTLCALLGIAPPALAQSPAFPAVLAGQQAALDGRPVQRLLIFAPDALGRWLMDKHVAGFQTAPGSLAPIRVELQSVLPTVTPVCFSSIFTGAYPAQHGIQKYERPLQRTDSFFDALVRAGKRCAIVAVVDCSMDIIFRERAIDYFTEPDDDAVRERGLELVKAGQHDVVVAYQCGYDDMLHQTVPESPECMAAFEQHLLSFAMLTAAAAESWDCDWAVCFIPDHGSHIDPQSGKGTHGSDLPADKELAHWWGLHAAPAGT